MKNDLKTFWIVGSCVILIPLFSIITLIVILNNIDRFPPFNKTHYDTIKQYTKIDLNKCKFKYVDQNEVTLEYILHCDDEYIPHEIKNWKTLPLPGPVKLMFYGGEVCFEKKCYIDMERADDYKLPKITKGSYYFYDFDTSSNNVNMDTFEHKVMLLIFDDNKNMFYFFIMNNRY